MDLFFSFQFYNLNNSHFGDPKKYKKILHKNDQEKQYISISYITLLEIL